jgi:hypothetical protein
MKRQKSVKEVSDDYTRDQVRRGSVKSMRELRTEAKVAVRQVVFGYKKFVNDSEMNYGGEVCVMVLVTMGYSRMGKANKESIWTTVKSTVRKTFDEKRSSTNCGMKKDWLGAYTRVEARCGQHGVSSQSRS